MTGTFSALALFWAGSCTAPSRTTIHNVRVRLIQPPLIKVEVMPEIYTESLGYSSYTPPCYREADMIRYTLVLVFSLQVRAFGKLGFSDWSAAIDRTLAEGFPPQRSGQER